MVADSITWSNVVIRYFITFSKRRTLGITVEPSRRVVIKAPEGISLELVKEKVTKRAGWIVKQLQYFESFGDPPPPRQYISGESHYYLGRQYLLKVEEGKPNAIKYKGHCFEITCSPKSKAKELLKGWYRERAKIKFTEIAEPVIVRFARYGVKPSSIYIREMESRWGSCSAKGKITLNTHLIKMPKPCIEYVITHELAHLVHPNHSKAFYQLLEAEMPDWKRWKERLERYMWACGIVIELQASGLVCTRQLRHHCLHSAALGEGIDGMRRTVRTAFCSKSGNGFCCVIYSFCVYP